MHTKTWTVEILLTEDEGATHARAHLKTEPTAEALIGHGLARVGPHDKDIPEIGDELAAARALSELAGRLLGTSADDIATATEEDVTLLR